MSTGKRRHLYTIWNPKHCATTIDEHINVLGQMCFVKWLILYDEKSEEDYKEILSIEDIKAINIQAANDEIFLFIQCLNIFHCGLFAGKVEKIKKEELTKEEIKKDPYIPKYYLESISNEKLKVHYQITLSELEPVDIKQVLNLTTPKKFRSEKFNYPFPCIVYQKESRRVIKVTGKFKRIVIAYGIPEGKKRNSWYVKIPERGNSDEPLTLGKKEVAFIELFENEESIMITTIKKQLRKLYQKKIPRGLKENCNDYNYLHRIRWRINEKFRNAYKCKILFKSDSGKFVRQANKLKIIPRNLS
jgi:hypothetical protein